MSETKNLKLFLDEDYQKKHEKIREYFNTYVHFYGWKESDIQCPNFDLNYYTATCEALKVYLIYVIHLSEYDVDNNRAPEVYVGLTRQEILDRVYSYYYSLKTQYEHNFSYKYSILYSNLNREEAMAMEVEVIAALRKSEICVLLNKSDGGELGGGKIENVFFKDVIFSYVDDIRLEKLLYYEMKGVTLFERKQISIELILHEPKILKPINHYVDAVAKSWENRHGRNSYTYRERSSTVLKEIKKYLNEVLCKTK